MPCNIGYKSYSKASIPTPKPQEFKTKTESPKIDADLLAKIGEDDPEFLSWLQELDIKPLLKEALKRTLSKIDSKPIKFSVDENGWLEAKSNYKNQSQKKKLERIMNSVFTQFQLEVIGIAAELMDYKVDIRKTGLNTCSVQGTKNEKTTRKHFEISIDAENQESRIKFEHFESEKSLKSEERKFLGLAQKLGVKIIVVETQKSGNPIPEQISDQDLIKGEE